MNYSVSRTGSEVTKFRAPQSQPFPPNYVTCFEFFMLPLKAMRVVFGPGLSVYIEQKSLFFYFLIQT
jgi:hypothetical protein